jgi:hypothetical protein
LASEAERAPMRCGLARSRAAECIRAKDFLSHPSRDFLEVLQSITCAQTPKCDQATNGAVSGFGGPTSSRQLRPDLVRSRYPGNPPPALASQDQSVDLRKWIYGSVGDSRKYAKDERRPRGRVAVGGPRTMGPCWCCCQYLDICRRVRHGQVRTALISRGPPNRSGDPAAA